MNQISLSSAMEALHRAVDAGGERLSPQVLTHTVGLALRMLQHAIDAGTGRDDPRLAAALASHVEQLYHLAGRARIVLAMHSAATGAHTLAVEEYDALRENRTDYSRPARYATGRPCHKTPADFLAAWLHIDYHEAAGMLQDAQLVIGRITVAGTLTSPRYERLAESYRNPSVDPRAVIRTARALNRLEPKDTIAAGVPLPPSARHSDGQPLEQHAARVLETRDPVTARKHIDSMVSGYTQEHTETKTPAEGLFKVRTVNGVDEYRLRVRGANAGLLRSLIAQADNPKTQAGTAARLSTSDAPAHDGVPEPEAGDWLRSTDPAPEWARDPQAQDLPDQKADPESATAAAATEPSPRPGTDPGTMAEEVSIADRLIEQLPPPIRRMNALMALVEQRQSSRSRSAKKGKGKCRCGDKQTVKTVEPELLVFLKLDDLQDLATAHGLTSHGVRLSPAELRKLLCKAKIIPVVFGGDGQILDLGRFSRLYPDYMKKGIIARDRGCIVPGCSHPPESCDVHHAGDGGWQGGCPTDIGQGTLLCRLHHTAEQAGITRVIMYRGLPHVLLPRYMDPTQTPQRNTYWETV